MIKRKCQIRAVSPITCFTVPIVGTTELNLTEKEIYECLCSGAEITEILPNNKTIELNFDNYNRINSIIGEPTEIKKETIITKIKDEPKFIEQNDSYVVETTDILPDNKTIESNNEKPYIVKAHTNESKNNNYKNNKKKKK